MIKNLKLLIEEWEGPSLLEYSLTESEACSYELKHREKYKDSRRLLFSRQLELLEYVSADYANRCKADILKILQSNPFDDNHHSIFDLIDDFGSIAKVLKNILTHDSLLSKDYMREVEKVIEKIDRLSQEGASDILEFCKDICKVMKLIYSGLKAIHRPDMEVAVQMNRLEGIIAIAEKVFAKSQ